MLHVDDLIETRPEELVLAHRLLLLRSHAKPPKFTHWRESREAEKGNRNRKEMALETSFPCKADYLKKPKIAHRSTRSDFFTGNEVGHGSSGETVKLESLVSKLVKYNDTVLQAS